MNFLSILKKCAVAIQKKQNSLFTYDVHKQCRYLCKLKEPVDDIERSFNQYKCQMKLYGIFLSILINFTSFFLTLIYLMKYRLNSLKSELQRADAVFLPDGKPKNILPTEVIVEYPNIKCENDKGICYLNNEDRMFLREIVKRYPLSWHFIFKCMIKIARYRGVIDKYSPESIIVCGEYSFTSSVLTAYCEFNNIQHINVMHGEKLFYMRDSFFRFHKFYIWNKYYKNLFLQLRAEPKQFIVSIPKALKFNYSTPVEKKIDYTYYLGNESSDELKKISKYLKKLFVKGFNIAIRPHPRYTDLKLVQTIFKEFEIENFYEISIEASILRTKRAIALYSTVLNQAFENGVVIVIDDITNQQRYSKLLELQYFILSKKHLLLSQLIGG